MRADAFLRGVSVARAVAILRARDQATAARAMEAAIRGGFRYVEFTMNTPGALELVAEFAGRADATVGAGTVLSAADAERAVAAGAQFLVSPVMDDAVLAATRALDVAFVPGCATPSEMLRAHRAGAAAVKLFPAPVDGPQWVRAVLGPLPDLPIVPTRGVSPANAAAWLAAGAVAVGAGESVFDKHALAAGRWDEVEANARALLAAIASL